MMCRYLVFSAAILAGNLLAADSQAVSKAWKALDDGLHDGRMEHRQQTVAALSTLPGTDTRAVQKVVNAMEHDSSVRVRQTAALALGQMKAQSAVPALEKALTDNQEVGFAAAKSLTELGSPAGEDYMVAVLKGATKPGPGMTTSFHRNARNQMLHPGGLALTGAAGASGLVFPPAGIGLAAAKEASGTMPHGKAGRVEAAADLAKHNDPASVDALQGALKDKNPDVQAQAAKGLGDLGDPASIVKLQPLLTDPHIRARTMAAASIIRLSH